MLIILKDQMFWLNNHDTLELVMHLLPITWVVESAIASANPSLLVLFSNLIASSYKLTDDKVCTTLLASWTSIENFLSRKYKFSNCFHWNTLTGIFLSSCLYCAIPLQLFSNTITSYIIPEEKNKIKRKQDTGHNLKKNIYKI